MHHVSVSQSGRQTDSQSSGSMSQPNYCLLLRCSVAQSWLLNDDKLIVGERIWRFRTKTTTTGSVGVVGGIGVVGSICAIVSSGGRTSCGGGGYY